MTHMEEAVHELQTVIEDDTVPKSVREKLQQVISMLSEPCDTSMKVDKAMQELDDVMDDVNMQVYTRTQIWSVVSLLEKC